MIHYVIKIASMLALVVLAIMALVHALPFIVIALAVIGVIKLYQSFRGPGPGSWR